MRFKVRYIIVVLLIVYCFLLSFVGGVVGEKYNESVGVIIFAFAVLSTYFMGLKVWDMIKKADKKE